jgi:restriction endonuclease Mrr
MRNRNLMSDSNLMSDRGSSSSSEHKSDGQQRSQSRFTPTPGTIADQLRQRLLALSYPAFAQCLCVLLEALGYEEVQPAGRQEWKGYNRAGGGGYDLEAVLSGGLAPRRVVAQIKQYDGLNVFQRSVDELRGACLRRGAAEAILVTTSDFSQVVLKHAAAPDASGMPIAPVRLIDGKELLSLLIQHRLGVRETAHDGVYRLELDEAFFQIMSTSESEVGLHAATKPLQKASKPQRAKNSNADLRWNMTIYLSGNNDLSGEKTVKGGR